MSDERTIPAAPDVPPQPSQRLNWTELSLQTAHHAAIVSVLCLLFNLFLPFPADWRLPALLVAGFILAVVAMLAPICTILLHADLPRPQFREALGLLIFACIPLAASILIIIFRR